MTVVSIPTLDIFAPAISYHEVARQFCEEHGTQIVTNAQALSAELHKSAPQVAGEFDKAIQTLAQRLTDEATLHHQSVANLTSHFTFLATREAAFSGTSPQTLPYMPQPSTGAWLDIQHTPLNGIFDEVERKLREFSQDLEALDGHLNAFEHLINTALSDPDQLVQYVQLPEAGWEPDWLKSFTKNTELEAARYVGSFIQGCADALFWLINQARQAFNTLFVPRTDPGVLQGHIDYVTALKNAYDHYIRASFNDATRPIATQYHPPDGQDSYQKAWPSIPEQQGHTSMALSNAISQLQLLQTQNEIIAINAGIMIVALVACGVAVAFCLGVVPIPASAPAAGGSAGTAAGAGGEAAAGAAASESLVANLVGSTFLGIPAWWWGPITMIGGTIVENNLDFQPDVLMEALRVGGIGAALSTLAYTWVEKETVYGPKKMRELTQKEVKKLRTEDGTPFEREKQKQGYGSTDVIYVTPDGEYFIGTPDSEEAAPFP